MLISGLCVAVLLILVYHVGPMQEDYKDKFGSFHSVQFKGSPSFIVGLGGAVQSVGGGSGLNATQGVLVKPLDTENLLTLGAKPFFEIKTITGQAEDNGHVIDINLWLALTDGTTTSSLNCNITPPISIKLLQGEEFESVNVVTGYYDCPPPPPPTPPTYSDYSYEFRYSTTSSIPIGLVSEVVAMPTWVALRVLIAFVILIFIYVLIIQDVMHRTLVAMLGSFVSLFILAIMTNKPPTLQNVVVWIDESTLLLLFSMMVSVTLLSRTGVFQFLSIQMLSLSGPSPKRLLIFLSVCTGLLSAFLDNVTTMLLISPVAVTLSLQLKMPSPLPLLMSCAFMSNIYGCATMIGDPPNVIIGTLLSDYIGFVDFIINLFPVVLIATPFTLAYLVWWFKDSLKVDKEALKDFSPQLLERQFPITNQALLLKASIIFGTTMLGFFLEPVHHVSVSWVSVFGAFGMLMVCSPKELRSVFESVEWDTLLFFACLFVMISSLSEMGLVAAIGDLLSMIVEAAPPESQLIVAIVVILWISALVSGFLENTLYTSAMVVSHRYFG